MNDVLRLVCDYSLLIVSGSTLLLGVGCAAVGASRSPAHRQRLSELTVGGTLVWLVLTLLPLPRLASPLLGLLEGTTSDATVSLPSPPLHESLPAESQVVSELSPEAGLRPVLVDLRPGDVPLPDDSEAVSMLLEGPKPSTAVVIPADNELPSPIPAASPGLWKIDTPSASEMALGLYLIGAAACAALLLVGNGLLLWIRVSAKRPPVWLDAEYQELAWKVRAVKAELLLSQRCSRPISWGLFRPIIVLPSRLCHAGNRKLVGAVLLHELGHVVRRDAWGNLLFCIALPLLYCHPMYWWLRREWNLAAELLADDWAAWQTGKDAYVEELMDLARTSPSKGFPFVGATAVFSSPSQFYRRMQMLLAREQPLTTRTSLLWQLSSIAVATLGIALASSLGGVRPVIAQSQPPSPVETVPTPEAPMAGEPASAAAPTLSEPRESLDAPTVSNGSAKPAPSATAAAPKAEAQVHAALIQELRAEQDLLKTRLQMLQARLKALGDAPATAAGPTKEAPTLQIGRPGAAILTTPEGRIEATDGKGGSVTLHVYDNATGKLVETVSTDLAAPNRTGQPKSTTSVQVPPSISTPPSAALPSLPAEGAIPPPPFVPSVQSNLPAARANPATTTRGQVRAQGFTSHRELDLLTLATSYADAVGALEAAEAKLADIESTAKQSPDSTSKQEITSARLAVAAARRKEELLQRIAKVALESASKELDRATQLHENGVVPAGDLEEIQTRTEILKQILTTQPDNQGNGLRGSPSTKVEGESVLICE